MGRPDDAGVYRIQVRDPGRTADSVCSQRDEHPDGGQDAPQGHRDRNTRPSQWPEPWKSARLMVLVRGNDRAAFWVANRATWRADLWTDILVQNTGIEQHLGFRLVGRRAEV